jgi:hypothetical protein
MVVETASIQGGAGICVFFDGIFVVNSWFLDGGMWCLDGRFSGGENFPLFLILFLFARRG